MAEDDREQLEELGTTGALPMRPSGRVEAAPPWFRLAAMVVLLAGTVAAVSLGLALSRTTSESVGGLIAIAAAVECGAIVLGAVLGFFAYALELMIDIRDQTRVVAELAFGPEEEALSEP